MGCRRQRLPDIYRTCPLLHAIIDSLLGSGDLCLALIWNISMVTQCAHPIPLPQIFYCHSSNSVLSNSWPSSQTLSHCTWIMGDPNCWFRTPKWKIKWLSKALPSGRVCLYQYLSRILLIRAVTTQQLISEWWLHTVQNICKPVPGYFLCSKPAISEATDVDWREGMSGIDQVKIWASCSYKLLPCWTCLSMISFIMF